MSCHTTVQLGLLPRRALSIYLHHKSPSGFGRGDPITRDNLIVIQRLGKESPGSLMTAGRTASEMHRGSLLPRPASLFLDGIQRKDWKGGVGVRMYVNYLKRLVILVDSDPRLPWMAQRWDVWRPDRGGRNVLAEWGANNKYITSWYRLSCTLLGQFCVRWFMRQYTVPVGLDSWRSAPGSLVNFQA